MRCARWRSSRRCETFIPNEKDSIMTMPAGTVIAYLGLDSTLAELETKGWFKCDGRPMDSTTYPDLWGQIGNTYGSSAEGSFNLPDLRGMFLRAVDPAGAVDPDGKERTSPVAGDPGVAGPVVGSRQAHQVVRHQHHWDYNFGHISDVGSDINVQLATGTGEGDLGSQPTTNVDGGGNETRPSNVYVYYLIYAG
jgi:Phage Tail Collar Domain